MERGDILMQCTEYYTVAQVAQILQVKKACIYDFIQSGKLKAVRFSERRTRISEESLTVAIEELSNQGSMRYTKVAQPPKRGRPRIGTA